MTRCGGLENHNKYCTIQVLSRVRALGRNCEAREVQCRSRRVQGGRRRGLTPTTAPHAKSRSSRQMGPLDFLGMRSDFHFCHSSLWLMRGTELKSSLRFTGSLSVGHGFGPGTASPASCSMPPPRNRSRIAPASPGPASADAQGPTMSRSSANL